MEQNASDSYCDLQCIFVMITKASQRMNNPTWCTVYTTNITCGRHTGE